MPSTVWCARKPYHVAHDSIEILRRIEEQQFFFLDLVADCSPAPQVLINAAHVSSVEVYHEPGLQQTSSAGTTSKVTWSASGW